MKKIKLLPVLLGLLLGVAGFAQTVETYYAKERDSIPPGRIDTVAVNILVCDSCDDFEHVFIKKAYRVRVKVQFSIVHPEMCKGCIDYWEFILYLDERKRRLSDCFKIWLEKTLNN